MSLNRQKYHSFATFLAQLRDDATTPQINAAQLRQRLAVVHQFYQQEIVPLADEDTETLNSQEQSYRTEISKQLRLLEIDVMFFQGARQPSTAQARLGTISDRLTTLLQYCNAILTEKTPPPDAE